MTQRFKPEDIFKSIYEVSPEIQGETVFINRKYSDNLVKYPNINDKLINYSKQRYGTCVGLFSKDPSSNIYYPRMLPYDFDVERKRETVIKDLELMRQGLVEIVEEMQQRWGVLADKDLMLYFTGARGFRIELNIFLFGLDLTDCNSNLPKAMGKLAELLCPDKFFDSSIYQQNHLIRYPNSLNLHSVKLHDLLLHQVYLTFDELKNLTINEIVDLARTPCQYPAFDYDIQENRLLANKFRESIEIVKIGIRQRKKIVKPPYCQVNDGINFGSKLYSLCPLLAAVLKEGIIDCEDRSVALFNFAHKLSNLDFNDEDIAQLLLIVDSKIYNYEGYTKLENRRNADAYIGSMLDKLSEEDSLITCYHLRSVFNSLKEACKECGPQQLSMVREELTEEVEYLDEGVLIVKLPPGTGKTVTVLQTEKRLDHKLLIVGLRHSLYEEVVKILGEDVLHIKGREQLCQYKDISRNLAIKGFNVKKQLCVKKNCIDDCLYYKQFDNIAKSKYVFTVFDMFFSNGINKLQIDTFDRIILDENFTDKLIQVKSFSKKNIERIRDLIEYYFKINDNNDKMLDILNIIIKKIDDNADSENLVKEISNVITQKELEQLIKLKWDNLIENVIFLRKIKNKPPLFLDSLLDILLLEIKVKKFGRRIILKNNKLLLYYSRNFSQINKPMIVLDASLNEDIISDLFHDREIEFFDREIKIPTSTEIIQVSSGLYGKRYLTKKVNTLQRINKLIDLLAKRHQNLLVAGVKQVVEQIRGQQTARNINYCHYWGTETRGLNSYEECDAAILVGVAYPNESELISRVKAFYYKEDINPTINNIEVELTTLNEQFREIKKIREAQDPMVKNWFELLREKEMIQAAFRVRPLNGNKTIYILSNLPLPGLEPGYVYKTLPQLINKIDNEVNRPSKIIRFEKIDDYFEQHDSQDIIQIFEMAKNIEDVFENIKFNSKSKAIIRIIESNGLLEKYNRKKERDNNLPGRPAFFSKIKPNI